MQIVSFGGAAAAALIASAFVSASNTRADPYCPHPATMMLTRHASVLSGSVTDERAGVASDSEETFRVDHPLDRAPNLFDNLPP